MEVGEASRKAKCVVLTLISPPLAQTSPISSEVRIPSQPSLLPPPQSCSMPNASSYDFPRRPSTLCPAPSLGLLRVVGSVSSEEGRGGGENEVWRGRERCQDVPPPLIPDKLLSASVILANPRALVPTAPPPTAGDD